MRQRESALQREIQQRRPFRSVGHELLVGLLRTADVLRRRGSVLVESYGVTLQQYNVLRILRGAGKEGLPTLAIGERMIEQTPGITRLLDRLEAKGWVRRQRQRRDRRQVYCRITPAGLRLLARLDRSIDELDESAVGTLSDRQARTLIRLLDTVRASHGSLAEPSSSQSNSRRNT